MAANVNDMPSSGISNKASSHDNDGLTFVALLRALRKHLITVFVTFALTMVAVCVWTALSPVKYTTSTQLFATYNAASADSNVNEQNTGSSYIMSQIQSYPALVKTQVVLRPVIDDLHLDKSVSTLASEITVTNPANTAFINISVTELDAEQAAKIANSIASSLSNVIEKSLYSSGQDSSIKLTVVEAAQLPSGPSSPKWTLNVLVGIVAGIILGIVVGLLKDVFSKTVQDEDEAGELIDAPIIGRVPEDDLLNSPTPVIISEPGSPIAEDFRRIRTNLSFSTPVEGTNCRLVIVTSAGASEGKTTTSVNIAVTLAEDGSRVLLIDADLRHPSVARKIDIDGSAGLTHVLSGQAAVKDVIQRYWKPNLHVIPAGPKPPNASTLLNSPLMTTLVANAMQQYDYIIIDTAPMVVANDAVIFMKQGGTLEMVCRRGQTLKRDLREIADELETLDMPITGVIINCAKENKKALENSNYYYYSNSSNAEKGKRKK